MIEVTFAGICGSDLHMAQCGPVPVTLATSSPDLPPTAGRCCGSGRYVRQLPECLRGDVQLCTGERSSLGVGADGGMAEHVLVPEDCLAPLPVHGDVGGAGLMEPLALAVHGYRFAQIEAGMRVSSGDRNRLVREVVVESLSVDGEHGTSRPPLPCVGGSCPRMGVPAWRADPNPTNESTRQDPDDE